MIDLYSDCETTIYNEHGSGDGMYLLQSIAWNHSGIGYTGGGDLAGDTGNGASGSFSPEDDYLEVSYDPS